MPRKSTLLPFLGLLTTTPVSQSCIPAGCTAAGCSDLAVLTVDIPPREDLLDATVTACRNGECHTGTITWPDSKFGPRIEIERVQDKERAVSVWPLGSGDGKYHALQMSWWSTFDGKPAMAGDVYELTIESRGRKVLAVKETVDRYQAYRPNGEDCEPVCQKVAIDRSSGRHRQGAALAGRGEASASRSPSAY